jgi:hypothetical protein
MQKRNAARSRILKRSKIVGVKVANRISGLAIIAMLDGSRRNSSVVLPFLDHAPTGPWSEGAEVRQLVPTTSQTLPLVSNLNENHLAGLPAPR